MELSLESAWDSVTALAAFLLIIGGINWGSWHFLDLNLVTMITEPLPATGLLQSLTYGLVTLGGLIKGLDLLDELDEE